MSETEADHAEIEERASSSCSSSAPRLRLLQDAYEASENELEAVRQQLEELQAQFAEQEEELGRLREGGGGATQVCLSVHNSTPLDVDAHLER